MTDGRTEYQGIESEDVIDDNAPLICSDGTTSSPKYQTITESMDKSTSRKGFLKWIRGFSKRTKVLLSVIIVSITALLYYLLFLAPPSTRDHCVRHGYKTFETPVIPFNTSDIAIFLPNYASGGIIKISQITTDDDGTVYAHINTSSGDLADNITHVVDVTERRTRITVKLPDSYSLNSCVFVEMEIRVPAYTTSLSVLSTENVEIVADTPLIVDFVKMANDNAPIRLLGGWQGKDIVLGTTNAEFDFQGNHSLHATGSIKLYTSARSLVRLDDSSGGSIRVYSPGGRVNMRNTTATGSIEPITYTGFVSLQDTRALNITVITKEEGTIDLDHITVDNTLTAETQHGAIHAHLDGSQIIKATFSTYDGNLNITMPDDFRGHFSVYPITSYPEYIAVVGNNKIVMSRDYFWGKAGYTNKDGKGLVLLNPWFSSQIKLVF